MLDLRNMLRVRFALIALMGMPLVRTKKTAFLLKLTISYFIVKYIIMLQKFSNALFVKYYFFNLYD